MSASRTSMKIEGSAALSGPGARLLGPGGIRALGTIIETVDAEARRREWPVRAARICVEADPEDRAAQSVELVFTLDADPGEAEELLAACYVVLEESISGMSKTVRERLMNTLFFDVETV